MDKNKVHVLNDWGTDGGLTYYKALNMAESAGMRLVTVKEAVIPDFPIWTSTYVKYKGTDCTVSENGKSWKCKIPATSGWYLLDEHGLPFGKPSNKNNPFAKYLYRGNLGEGMVATGYGDPSVGLASYQRDGRGVYLGDDSHHRLGVLAVEKERIPANRTEQIKSLETQIKSLQRELDSLKMLDKTPKIIKQAKEAPQEKQKLLN